MVILGHNLDNSQVSVYRTIGPTLVVFVLFFCCCFFLGGGGIFFISGGGVFFIFFGGGMGYPVFIFLLGVVWYLLFSN